MKKAAVILLSFVYLLSVGGVSVNRFYCCGTLQSTSISAAIFSNSGQQDDACCKHTNTVVKATGAHDNYSSANIIISHFVAPLAVYANVHSIVPVPGISAIKSKIISGPPAWYAQPPLYITFCTYRI
ncbi:MAG TPA: hypothetical protein VHB48_19185 [Chitinophagaceae bacterium]|nr:hypothetical protein [Chitinophagaceae bacterium]